MELLRKRLCAGPLWNTCFGKTPTDPELQRWMKLGESLLELLAQQQNKIPNTKLPSVEQLPEDSSSSCLPPPSKDNLSEFYADSKSFCDLYLPVFLWIKRHISSGGPTLVALSAPQGSGKTTLGHALELLFEADGLRCVSCSLDDFYLRYDVLAQLATTDSLLPNPLLQFRGNPGTHDIPLLEKCLEELRRLPTTDASSGSSSLSSCFVPIYDKAARNGRGDRKEGPGREVEAPVDVVVVEGWMMGFRPLDWSLQNEEAVLQAMKSFGFSKDHSVNFVKQIDRKLEDYLKVFDMLDLWLIVEVDSVDMVSHWRLQQEKDLAKTASGKVLSHREVSDFVSRFVPSYLMYCPQLYRRCVSYQGQVYGDLPSSQQTSHESWWQSKNVLRIPMDENRSVMSR
eukprot:GHVS01078166.1.p1 GENE.GHVS01078166.1~~GHVS01078166.1.p1  ORF type:complete len:398 (-),score=72.91 GHVS01078166.1:186-1379(-)